MSNIRKQLESLNIYKTKLSSGTTLQKELERHAKILADCIRQELNRVYDSYSPKVYVRSFDLLNSIYVDDVYISAKGGSISVSFNDGAIHQSFNKKNEVNMATLINEGYQTHGSFAHVPYLGYRLPTHFIEKGIQRYKAKVKNPFKVRMNILGEIREF